jgi:hypothetical protein
MAVISWSINSLFFIKIVNGPATKFDYTGRIMGNIFSFNELIRYISNYINNQENINNFNHVIINIDKVISPTGTLYGHSNQKNILYP